MNKALAIFIIKSSIFLILSCKKNNTCTFSSAELNISFIINEEIPKNSYITIDNRKFVFTTDIKLINNQHMIPSDKFIIHKKGGEKPIIEKNSNIYIGISLWEKLKKQNEYILISPSMLLTKGALKIKRKDNKEITISIPCELKKNLVIQTKALN